MSILCFSKRISSSLICPCFRLPPSSFTFSLFLPCSSSSSSYSTHSETPDAIQQNVISEVLLNECGLSSSQLTKVMINRPSLLKIASAHTARQAIQLLKDSGLTEIQLRITIVRNPSIIELKVDGQLKPKMEFMKTLGFAPQALATLISKRPRLLSFSLENSLRPKISFLKNLFGSNVNLCKALTVAPDLVNCDIEKQIKPKVEYVKNNMGISEGSKLFPYALHAVLSHRPESLERKVKNMTSLGFLDEEIRQIIKKSPLVLCVSTNKMQENMNFYINVADISHKDIVSNPGLLFLSIEKRLKPRYEVFKSLSVKQNSKRLPTLLRMLTMTDQYFLEKFSQCNVQGLPEKGCNSNESLTQIVPHSAQ